MRVIRDFLSGSTMSRIYGYIWIALGAIMVCLDTETSSVLHVDKWSVSLILGSGVLIATDRADRVRDMWEGVMRQFLYAIAFVLLIATVFNLAVEDANIVLTGMVLLLAGVFLAASTSEDPPLELEE